MNLHGADRSSIWNEVSSGAIIVSMNGHQHLTIELPQPEAEFVRTYAKQNNLSIDTVIDRLIQGLERMTTRRVDPILQSMVGMLPPDTDVDAVRMEYLAEKYLRNDRND